MTGIPELGERVRIWPHPSRQVTNGPAPFTTTGAIAHRSFLDDKGTEVVWTKYHLEQFHCGDILLHDPQPQGGDAEDKE